jgi:hypothetical protein
VPDDGRRRRLCPGGGEHPFRFAQDKPNYRCQPDARKRKAEECRAPGREMPQHRQIQASGMSKGAKEHA